MSQKKFWRSFAGGIITPELFGRLDLTQNQTGLADARNFEILPYGPAANRAGFEYILHAKFPTKACRVIPFIFNTQQTYALEFGDQYVRFHTNSGTLLEASQPILNVTAASPAVVTQTAHGYTNGQWVFLDTIVGPTLLNGRFVIVQGVTANTYQLTDLNGNNIDTSAMPVYTSGGIAARVYEVPSSYVAADLFDLHYTQNQDTLTIVHPSYQQSELKRLGAASWTLTPFTLVPVQDAPTALNVTPSGAGAEVNGYVVTAIAADGQEESLAAVSATGTGVALATAGAFNTIKWTASVASAVRYNVYKLRSGLYGYIGQALNGTIGFKDDNIFPNMAQTPPEGVDPFTSANNFPGAVGYHEQRRAFAGTNTKPQNLWATRSATEKNLTYSIPSQASDSLAFRIAARQVNRIRHIVPLQDMMLMTSGGAWRVTSGTTAALTPSSIDVKIQSNIGASNVQPIIADNAVLYAQSQGGHVYEMRLQLNSAYQSVYTPEDASLMAPQLFDGFTLVDMAYTQAPRPQAWFVRSDGMLLGMTYLPKHEVRAWHRHDTAGGTFESVCSVTEGNEDILYAVVNRTIAGRQVRFIERKHSRQFTLLADCFFVDAGLSYSGTPITIVNGLYHLEGATVSVMADGVVNPPVVVKNGSITLDHAASNIHIGLMITADLQTLPLAMEQAQAFAQGTFKNIDKVYLRLNKSSQVFVGPNFTELKPLRQRTTEPYGSPPNLVTGEFPLTLENKWGADGTISIRQTDPLPLTLVALTADTVLGG